MANGMRLATVVFIIAYGLVLVAAINYSCIVRDAQRIQNAVASSVNCTFQ